MEIWAIPILVIVVASLLLAVASRMVARRTGRARVVRGFWALIVPVGTGGAVMVTAVTLNPGLPWLATVAGVAAGIFGLAAQVIAGGRVA